MKSLPIAGSDVTSKFLGLNKESKVMQLYDLLAVAQSSDIPKEIDAVRIRQRAESLIALRKACATDDGWEVQKESYGVKTLYQNHPQSPHIHSIRLDGDVDAPMFTILALLHEVDLFPKWLPTYSFLGLNFAKCLDHPSPTELVVHLNINVPWPITNRYCLFNCDGIDCIDDPVPQIGVILKTLEDESQYNVADDSVKAVFHPPSGILLTPLADGRTKTQICINVDPSIAFVPAWLIDMAVRNLAYLIVVAIRRAVEIVKSDPEYHGRMTDPSNQFYNHIRRRITESLPNEAKYIPQPSNFI